MQTVCIQGLGFVGSAMSIAVAIAEHEQLPKFNVIGVDLPSSEGQKRIDSMNNGIFPFDTNDEFLISSQKKIFRQGNLRATSDPSVFSRAQTIIIDINLDIPYLDSEPNLDMRSFENAIREVGHYVTAGTLILIETTVPPGTCEKIVFPCIKKELAKRNIDEDSVFIAHSYERVMPGQNYLKSIVEYPRVYSGINEASADACEKFLEQIIDIKKYPLTRLSSTIASETAKVLENTYRATNIAFIDEWTKYAEAIGIDLFEIIDAIKQRSTHSNIRYPGLGVGGYCLTKDPAFAPAAAKKFFNKDLDFPFSKLAIETNNNMPQHVISRIELLCEGNDDIKSLICGVTYRQDVADTRYSASEILVKQLLAKNIKVTCHDPYIKYWEELDISVCCDLPDLSGFDIIVMSVNHEFYKKLDESVWDNAKIILDANMVFSKTKIQELRDKGIKVESIGRGEGV